jgi:Fe-S oxidoreductase
MTGPGILRSKDFAPGTDVLYFPCCVPSYDPDVKGVARSTVAILDKLGVDYGLIGTGVKCCGEAIRKAGHEETFQSLAQNNIGLFSESGVKTALVSSPHCYHTFKTSIPNWELSSRWFISPSIWLRSSRRAN